MGSGREKKRGKKVEIEGKAVEAKSKEGGRRRSRNTLPNAGVKKGAGGEAETPYPMREDEEGAGGEAETPYPMRE